MNSIRNQVASLVVALSVACFRSGPAPVAFDGCSTDAGAINYDIRTAASAIISDRGAGGPQIRLLAGVPLSVDSVRAHSQVVTDRAICARLWRALDEQDREPRLTVVRIGRTYWVRLSRAVHGFDDEFRPLTTIVDL